RRHHAHRGPGAPRRHGSGRTSQSRAVRLAPRGRAGARRVHASDSVIETVLAGAAGAALGALATGVYHPNSRLFGRAIGWGPHGARHLFLTFDDGPNPAATEPILETLTVLDVPAAFFVVGEHVR